MAGKKPSIGLALGGGAARGIAHLGVLRVLSQEGIIPDVITGTSVGALVGAMFATYPNGEALVVRVKEYFGGDTFSKLRFDFLRILEEEASRGILDSVAHAVRKTYFYNLSLTRPGFVNERDYLENIAELVNDIPIKATRVRFGAMAMDLYAGTEVLLAEGSLRRAVAASSAIPGIFPPITIDGRLLADGGWVSQLPVGPCRSMGADVVIAVDVARELEETFHPKSGVEILRRANAITRYRLVELQRREADIVIAPVLADIGWAGFDRVEECILRGEEAARRSLPRIRDVIAARPSLLSRLFGRSE